MTQHRTDQIILAHHDYARGLTLYALFKLGNRQTSADAVQDTFLKALTYLANGGTIDVMKAFLYHVLNRLIIDEYRKYTTTSLDVLLCAGFEPIGEEAGELATLLDGKRAVLMLTQLPTSYAAVLRMRYVEDLSLADMSRRTGRSKNALAVQTYRGLQQLKTLYNRPVLAALPR